MNTLAPIVLFVYNRPTHLKMTINSLLTNKLASNSELYIFSDGSKNPTDRENVSLVREYLHTISGFKNLYIVEQKQNIGLANSVINGTSTVFQKYEKAIILEDDLLLSPYFLEYMNQALDFYKDNEYIFSIAGYSLPIKIPTEYQNDVYILPRTNSWGWATWKNRWTTVDWEVSYFKTFIRNTIQRKEFARQGDDITIMLLKQMQGKIDSWAVRFNYSCFIQKKVNIYSVNSLVINKGTDGSGSHIKNTSKFDTNIATKIPKLSHIEEINPIIAKNFKNQLKSSIIRRIINFFKLHKYLRKNI